MNNIYICVSAIFSQVAYLFYKPSLQPISISNNNVIPGCSGNYDDPIYFSY